VYSPFWEPPLLLRRFSLSAIGSFLDADSGCLSDRPLGIRPRSPHFFPSRHVFACSVVCIVFHSRMQLAVGVMDCPVSPTLLNRFLPHDGARLQDMARKFPCLDIQFRPSTNKNDTIRILFSRFIKDFQAVGVARAVSRCCLSCMIRKQPCTSPNRQHRKQVKAASASLSRRTNVTLRRPHRIEDGRNLQATLSRGCGLVRFRSSGLC
jgi:hypothetical protein